MFIELKEKGRVESCILFAGDNSINTTNPMNTINKYAGFENSILNQVLWVEINKQVREWLKAVSCEHLIAYSLNR